VLAGRQYGQTVYLLLKGTLQVSQAPPMEAGSHAEKDKSVQVQRERRASPVGTKDMRKQPTRLNTKGFKDKLKVRMLEKPGSLIPYAEVITEGPKPSLFSIFAVTRCQMLALEASDLNRTLKSYPNDDAHIVHDAIRKEFSGLVESLKMSHSLKTKDAIRGNSKAKPDAASSASAPKASELVDRASPSETIRRMEALRSSQKVPNPSEAESLSETINRMEAHAAQLVAQIEGLQARTTVLPKVLAVLHGRIGTSPSASS